MTTTETTLRDDVQAALCFVAYQQGLRDGMKYKVRNYTANQCIHAIADCHDTLQQGQYEYTHPYAQKLWAEIDALRDRQRFLSKC